MVSAGCSQKCYFGFLSYCLKPHHGYPILIVARREGQLHVSTKKESIKCCWCAGVDLVWELPPNRHTACTLQIQLSDKSPQAVNKATHKSWASEYGVICLGGSSTFFTIDGADEPQFWPPDGLRVALKPSGDLCLLFILCCNPSRFAASAESTQRHPILSSASAVQSEGGFFTARPALHVCVRSAERSCLGCGKDLHPQYNLHAKAEM